MNDEVKKRVKILSRYLGVPKDDITPELGDIRIYTVETLGQWSVLDEEEYDEEQVYTTDLLFRKSFIKYPENIREAILENPEDYVDPDCSFFKEVAYEACRDEVSELDTETVLEEAENYGISTDNIEDEDDFWVICNEVAQAKCSDIEDTYYSYYDWYLEIHDKEDLVNLLERDIVYPDDDAVLNLIYNDAPKYLYPLMSVDGNIEEVRDYFIFRVV